MSESPPHPFYGSLRKIDRAETHLDSLRSEIGSFFERVPHPYRFASKVDVETSRYLLYVFVETPFPAEWGLIVGDFVQNLRAALDHMACALVRANGMPVTSSTAFPIFDLRPPNKRGHGERERWERMTFGMHPAAIQWIDKHTQPYHGPDGPGAHTLNALRRLSNEDKHRVLLPAVGAMRVDDTPPLVDVVAVRDVQSPVEGGRLYANRPLKSGDLVLEADVVITGPNPEVKLESDFPLNIGFGRKQPIVPVKGLVQMFEGVRTTVHAAAQDLMGEPWPEP